MAVTHRFEMLQINNGHTIPAAESSQSGSDQLAELVELILGLLRRQYLIILSCLVLALAAGGVYLLYTPPTYTASAQLMIDTRTGQFLPQRSVMGDTPVDSPWIDSQMTIIRSEHILESVAKKLKLDADPEFGGSSPLLSRPIPDLAKGETNDLDRLQQAIGVLDKNLDVSRVGMSYVIEIKARARNADRAAQIANSVADAYLTDQFVSKARANQRASEWLQERLQALRQQSAEAEQAVIEFKSKNNIVDAEGKLMNEQQLADLNTRLVAARASTAEAEARLSQIETVLKADRPDTTLNAVSDSLTNPIITKLRTQYLELVNREAEWSSRYGTGHSAVVKIRDQLRDLRRSIQSELRRIAESYRSDYAIAKRRQSELEKRVEALVAQSQETNQARIKLRTLESAAQSYRTLYDNFLQRYTEAQQAFRTSEARVISPAYPPLSKSHPRTALVGAITVVVGLALGFGLAFFRELMDRGFRTSGQVHAVVGADCVAMVPRLTAPTVSSSSRLELSPTETVPRHIWCDTSAVQAIVNSPFAPFAEAIRSIKLAADLDPAPNAAKVIGLISSVPGEGKSTVAMALAGLMAQSSSRVVLVDCDLRNPSLSRSLAPKAKTGLLDIVFGNEPLEQAIWTDARTRMAFIPSLVGSHLPHTSEILASTAMKNLFDQLRSRFDYVIVDLSPLAAGVDARLSAAFIDAYVLVVKWGKTTTNLVQHALFNAPEVRENLLGVVLNQVDFRQVNSYESYRASYHYGRELYG